jgi:hypothetical protein
MYVASGFEAFTIISGSRDGETSKPIHVEHCVVAVGRAAYTPLIPAL